MPPPFPNKQLAPPLASRGVIIITTRNGNYGDVTYPPVGKPAGMSANAILGLQQVVIKAGGLPLRILPETVSDPCFAQIIRGHFEAHSIPNGKADEVFAHFSREMSQHLVLIVELDAEHGAGKHC